MPRTMRPVEKISYEQELVEELAHFREAAASYAPGTMQRRAVMTAARATASALRRYRADSEFFERGIDLTDPEDPALSP